MKTVELVLIGHPDKVCDGIAEALKKLNKNGHGRNAIEVVWFNDTIIVGGETDKKWNDCEIQDTVRDYLQNIVKLTDTELDGLMIINKINTQSHEIYKIVGNGAGDNGIFYSGWDVIYSPTIFRLKALCKALSGDELGDLGYRTDGKLIAEINDFGMVETLTLNIASYAGRNILPDMLDAVIRIKANALGIDLGKVTINPKGDWHKCFGFADSGLTGRKLACDTQCGLFRNGGGAWFGKDYSKADYSIPIYLTFLAKQLCEEGETDNVELFAHSIIGDTHIDIFENNEQRTRVQETTYENIVDFVATKEVDIFGGFNELAEE